MSEVKAVTEVAVATLTQAEIEAALKAATMPSLQVGAAADIGRPIFLVAQGDKAVDAALERLGAHADKCPHSAGYVCAMIPVNADGWRTSASGKSVALVTAQTVQGSQAIVSPLGIKRLEMRVSVEVPDEAVRTASKLERAAAASAAKGL